MCLGDILVTKTHSLVVRPWRQLNVLFSMSALLPVPRKVSGTTQMFHKWGLCEGMDEWTDRQLSSRWPTSFLNGEDHTWLDLPELTPTARGGRRRCCCVLPAVSPPQPNSAPPSAAKPSGRKSTNPGKCSAWFLAHRLRKAS